MSDTSNQKPEFLVIAEIQFLPGRVNYATASPLLAEDEALAAVEHLEQLGMKVKMMRIDA